MGRIIALDTSVFIYVFEGHPSFLKQAENILRQVESGRVRGIFSIIGMIELQTGPKKLNRYDIAARYRELIKTFPNLFVGELNEQVVEMSSDLRGRYGITTPDAIHLATAITAGADRFITNDQALRKVKEIDVDLL